MSIFKRKKKKTIYIKIYSLVYIWGYDPVSIGIRFFQNIFYALHIKKRFNQDTPNHIEVYIGNGLSISAEPDKVKKVKIKRHFKKHCKVVVVYPKHWQIPTGLSIPQIDAVDAVRKQDRIGMKRILDIIEGMQYDYSGLFGFIPLIIDKLLGVRSKRYDDTKKVFCSEACCMVYAGADIQIGSQKECWKLSPAESWGYVKDNDKFVKKDIWNK